jgi:D-beta-D-heptose 7-phosphate kinase / D-beta-D-heptose 1-phosphate adenosyltransferase
MANDGDLLVLIERLKSARVLCIGDVVLDHVVRGTPMPSGDGTDVILTVESEERRVDGAGRVLRDLAALGAAASFVSVVGNDDSGREIERLLAAVAGAEIHLLVQPDRSTATSSRFFAGGRQMLRADRESATPLGPYIREDLLRLARELVTSHGAVVISDHGKGVLTEGVALEIIRAAAEAGSRSVVDGGGGDPIRYRGADLLTANRDELAHSTGMPVADDKAVAAAAGALIERCALGAVLVSLGAGGSMVVEAGGMSHVEPDTDDAGVAIVAAALAAGMPVSTALRLAATDPTLVAATPASPKP